MSMAVALEQYGPFTVAAGRIGIGALALLAVVAVTRPADLAINNPKALCFILLLGILNFALPFSLLAWGIQRVPSAFAGITMGTSPIFVLLLAYIFVPDEQIGPRRIAGVILGFVGLLVLILPEVLAGQVSGGTVVAKIGGALLFGRCHSDPPRAADPSNGIHCGNANGGNDCTDADRAPAGRNARDHQ
ncbi:DMT family transporter [Falsihalocynthiibacter arcticus]|nr:DMT family transporter [Falsihalocynthiibacter arcticus]